MREHFKEKPLKSKCRVTRQSHVEVFACLIRGHPVYDSAEVQMFNVLLQGSKYYPCPPPEQHHCISLIQIQFGCKGSVS